MHMRITGLLLAALLFLVGGAAAEEAKTVEAEGFGDIIDGDVARARDEALRDAYRRAIEAAGVQMDAVTEVRDFEVFYDQVIARSHGYIREYEILDEVEKTEEGLFRVDLRAEVVPENIQEVEDRQALEQLIEMAGNPVLIVAGPGEGAEIFDSSPGLLEKLAHAGYELHADRLETLHIPPPDGREGEEIPAARELAEEAGADIVLLLTAEVGEGGTYEAGDHTFYGASARVRVMAASSWTGRVLRVWTEERTEPGGSYERAAQRAVERALDKVGRDVVWELPRYAGAHLAETLTVEVLVEGLSSFSRARDFKDKMENFRDVQALYLRNFERGEARFDVHTSGGAEELALRLEDMEEFDIAILSLGRERLEVEVKP